MKRRLSLTLWGAIVLFWFMLVLLLYYYVHKPISPTQASLLAQACGRVLVGGAVIGLAGGLGAWIMPGVGLRPLARLAYQAGVGLGILAVGVLMSGVLIGYSPLWAWGMVFALALLLRRHIWEWGRQWKDLAALWEAGGRLGRCLAVCVGLMLACTLLIALAPPVKFDALVYHLALPKVYTQAGRFAFTGENIFWGMPQTAEMLYTWVWLLDEAVTSAVLGWMVGVITLAGLLGYMAQRWGARPAWVSSAALLSGLTLALTHAWAYVDGWLMLSGWGVIVSLDLWQTERQPHHLVLAGVFAGIAISTKYTGSVLALVVVVYLLSALWREGKEILKSMALFLLALILVSLPWWVKNLWATGNPLYPFVFTSPFMDDYRLQLYQGLPPWGAIQDVMLLPVQATVWGVEGAPGFSASIGPLLLGLGVFAALGARSLKAIQKEALSIALWVALPGMFIWAVASRFSRLLIQTRLYFGLFPALALLAGVGFWRIANLSLPRLRLGVIVGALLLLPVVFNLWEVGVFTVHSQAPALLLGLQDEKAYLEKNLGWYTVAMEEINALPTFSRVLMLWEARSLYCLPYCDPDEVLDRWLLDRRKWGDPAHILEGWRSEGYTHLLVYRLGVDFVRQSDDRFQPADWHTLELLLNGLPAPTRFGEAYELYTLP
ncbi:MAG: hypothetical protein AB1345_09615 [Chloroflexota bacterium]